MTRKFALVLAAVFLVMAPLRHHAEAQPTGTVTVGLSVEPTSLDKNLTEAAPGFPIYPSLFEYLVQVDPNSGKLEPMLATSWKPVDQTTWEFRLRQGVKFHNGEPFDAEAVKFTVETVLTTPTAVVRGRIRDVERVDIVDKYTVRFVSSKQFTLLPQSLSAIAMYPPKYFKEKGQGFFSHNPSGTGKFKFLRWDTGVSLLLQAFDDHWGEKAQVRNLFFRFIPETNTRLAALERGEVDIAVGLPPDDAKRLEGAGLKVISTPLAMGMLVQIKPVQGTPLADKRVRQALNYAIDKESIVKNVALGFPRILDGQLVGPDGFGHNPKLKPYPYDLEQAKRLLAQAGYPNGFAVKFQSSQGRYVLQREVSEAVAAQLRRVGLQVDFEVLEWGTFVRKVLQTLDSAPLFYIGWVYFPVMDADWVVQHMATDSPYKLFSNARIDDLFQKQRNTFDPRERRALLQELMATIREEAPAIFLFQGFDVFAYRSRVVGFQPTPDNALHFDNVRVR